MTFPSLTANICLLSSFTTTNCFSLFIASKILLHQLLRPIILSLKIVKKSRFGKFNWYFFGVSISRSWEILSVDFASWEIFRKARKKVTKRFIFIVLSKKKAFHSPFFPLWFQTCQCTLWSSKIHRRFLKVTTSGHFHVGSQVWFKPTI